MGFLPVSLVCLASLLGTFANEDLSDMALVFLKGSDKAVEVEAQPNVPLTAFTVCMWHHSEHPGSYALFSYAMEGLDKAIYLRKEGKHVYSLNVGRENMTFGVRRFMDRGFRPVHVCASWESNTGIATLFENGKPFPRQEASKNFQIQRANLITLGQYAKPSTTDKPYIGEIWDTYMWNSVLSPEEVALIVQNQPAPKPIIDWRALLYKIKGNVVVKPVLPPACPIMLLPQKHQCY